MSSDKWEKHSAQTHLYSLCLLKPVTALVSIVHARPVFTIPLYSTMTAIWVFYAIPPEHIKCLSLHLFVNSVSHSVTICFLHNDLILPILLVVSNSILIISLLFQIPQHRGQKKLLWNLFLFLIFTVFNKNYYYSWAMKTQRLKIPLKKFSLNAHLI